MNYPVLRNRFSRARRWHALAIWLRLWRQTDRLMACCAGLAGGYLSLSYTPQWIENMTAGRGWIALALVVFASWLPWRAAVGAYLFGAISILAYTVQTFAWGIPSQFLSSLPYLVTIAALVVISGNRTLTRANTPACLGQSFVPDR